MASVVVFDPDHSIVPNRVTQWLVSISDVSSYIGASNALVWASPPIEPNPMINPWPDGLAPEDAKVIDTDADGVLDSVVEMTQAEKDAIETAENQEQQDAARAAGRAGAKATVDLDYDQLAVLVRAVVLIILDEMNRHALEHNDLLQWLGNQTALTDRPQLTNFQFPVRTGAQLKQAIKDKVDTGAADE